MSHVATVWPHDHGPTNVGAMVKKYIYIFIYICIYKLEEDGKKKFSGYMSYILLYFSEAWLKRFSI